MRWAWGTALISISLLLPTRVSAQLPGGAADWFVGELAAESEGFSGVVHLRSEILQSGAGTLVWGAGAAVPTVPSWVQLVNVGDMGTTASLRIGPAALYADARLEVDDRADSYEVAFAIELPPHGTASVLSYFANGTGTAELHVEGETGSLSARLIQGEGSAAVFVDRGATTALASAAFVAAGSSQVVVDVDQGVVGAMDYLCTMCTGRWTHSDSIEGRWRTASSSACLAGSYLPEGVPWFAGPKGTWSWTWAGFTCRADGTSQPTEQLGRQPVLAAWAPVGPYFVRWGS